MGKGICPVLGTILPAINVDVADGTLVTLLNTRTIRVFDTLTGVQITKRNYKNFLMRRTVAESAQTSAPIEPVKVSSEKVDKKTKKSTTKKPVEEVPATVETVPETTLEETTSEPVETPATEEVSNEVVESVESVETNDATDDETTDSSTDTDETTESTTYNTSNKKKKRR